MTPKEFEQKVAWIETLLKKEGAKVTWNEKIPDPDNPKQKRQVDVTIRRGKYLTLVECRLHSAPQDVKWIEELHGRRASLNAYSVIAVSSSGFTEGAIKKAERFGIILRDFRVLTENEVIQWGKATHVYLEYIYFFDTWLYIVTKSSAVLSIASKPPYFRDSVDNPWPVDKIFRTVADKLHNAERDHGSVRVQLFTKDLFCGGMPIEEVILQSNYKNRRISVKLPVVSVYGTPIDSKDSMIIESQHHSNFEIYRHPNSNFVIVDLSVAPPMHRSIFKGILFDFRQPVNMRGFKIIGLESKGKSLSAIPFEITPIRKNGPKYQGLLIPDGSILTLPP